LPRQAKISENSLAFREISFRENFCFREKFRENFRLREKFLFPGWFSQKVFVLAKHFSFAQIFHQCFGSGYISTWPLNPDPPSEWKIFAKTFAKTNIFVSFFAKSEKKFSENLRENTKTKIFVSTLRQGQQNALFRRLFLCCFGSDNKNCCGSGADSISFSIILYIVQTTKNVPFLMWL
jgi:hypothetical protein